MQVIRIEYLLSGFKLCMEALHDDAPDCARQAIFCVEAYI